MDRAEQVKRMAEKIRRNVEIPSSDVLIEHYSNADQDFKQHLGDVNFLKTCEEVTREMAVACWLASLPISDVDLEKALRETISFDTHGYVMNQYPDALAASIAPDVSESRRRLVVSGIHP